MGHPQQRMKNKIEMSNHFHWNLNILINIQILTTKADQKREVKNKLLRGFVEASRSRQRVSPVGTDCCRWVGQHHSCQEHKSASQAMFQTDQQGPPSLSWSCFLHHSIRWMVAGISLKMPVSNHTITNWYGMIITKHGQRSLQNNQHLLLIFLHSLREWCPFNRVKIYHHTLKKVWCGRFWNLTHSFITLHTIWWVCFYFLCSNQKYPNAVCYDL